MPQTVKFLSLFRCLFLGLLLLIHHLHLHADRAIHPLFRCLEVQLQLYYLVVSVAQLVSQFFRMLLLQFLNERLVVLDALLVLSVLDLVVGDLELKLVGVGGVLLLEGDDVSAQVANLFRF